MSNVKRISGLVAGLFLFSSTTFASYSQSPPPFRYGTGDAVYVDFKNANYHIVYDLNQKLAKAESEITFQVLKPGFPVFDLVANPTQVTLDGVSVEVVSIQDPARASTFRMVKQSLSSGEHVLKMKHVFSENVEFRGSSVASAFWTSDLDDRQYLELYLPTSFEYDQYKMNLSIEVTGAQAEEHVLMANGKIQNLGTNRFSLEYPEFYTCSSMFFHLFPKAGARMKTFSFASMDGRNLPVNIYMGNSNTPAQYWTEAKKVLTELEADYGPFPHEQVVIYGAGSGGMEYSGATQSDLSSLGHELFHSYNARNVMPANGNSGWMDEALSSWRDNAYVLRATAGSTTQMAGHAVWTRMTDDAAYTRGAAFIAWIAGRFSKKGLDFKTYLKEHFTKHRHSTTTTEAFKDELSVYSGMDLTKDFNTYIYGVGKPKLTAAEKLVTPRMENPFHPRHSKEDLRRLLWPAD